MLRRKPDLKKQKKTVECSMQYGVDGCVAVRVYTAPQWLVQLDQICHGLIDDGLASRVLGGFR